MHDKYYRLLFFSKLNTCHITLFENRPRSQYLWIQTVNAVQCDRFTHLQHLHIYIYWCIRIFPKFQQKIITSAVIQPKNKIRDKIWLISHFFVSNSARKYSMATECFQECRHSIRTAVFPYCSSQQSGINTARVMRTTHTPNMSRVRTTTKTIGAFLSAILLPLAPFTIT